ncbi:MAG: EamA family transporter RarD [Thalassovita sp.]
MTDGQKGVAGMVLASSVWGLSSLYYKLLDHVPPLEVLSHRTLWSCVFFLGVLAVQGRLSHIRTVLLNRRALPLILIAAVTIAANWFLFILSIQIGKATEASLGYYIFPLVAVLIGVVVFREGLSRAQVVAVGLATLAVVVLTLGLGVAPWVSLLLSLTFGLYGLIKKKLDVGPVVSVTVEVLVLTPIALIVLFSQWQAGQAAYGANVQDTLLLMVSGPLTATPLILFSSAARRVNMSTVGLVQYVNPTLQFLCAVLVFREPFGHWHAIAFTLIWTALAIYSVATVRQDRAARRASSAAAGEGTTVMNSNMDASAKP